MIILFYKALFFPKTLNMQIYKNQYVLIKSISVNPQLVWFYCLNKWRELLVPNISKNLPFVCDQCLSESQFSEHFYHHLHRSLVRYRNWGLKTISTGQISVHNLYSNDFPIHFNINLNSIFNNIKQQLQYRYIRCYVYLIYDFPHMKTKSKFS